MELQPAHQHEPRLALDERDEAASHIPADHEVSLPMPRHRPVGYLGWSERYLATLYSRLVLAALGGKPALGKAVPPPASQRLFELELLAQRPFALYIEGLVIASWLTLISSSSGKSSFIVVDICIGDQR